MAETRAVICVVEDDAMICRALVRLLRVAGFTAETFESAEAFLRCPHRATCACLLLDIDLPGQSGRELARIFTAAQRHVPIIFLTAREPRTVHACPGTAVAWLTKPFEDHDLFAAIRKALTPLGKDSP